MPRRTSLTCCLLALGSLASAQSAPTVSSNDETVVLSPFMVSSDPATRYQATEATSGTRVRISLMDSPQSVSVVTRELIEDIGAGRVLEAAKYVAGVYESTIPNAQDRTTIRGFQNDGATVDGFSYFSFANLDPAIVDRIEVVKGPNAIMAPQGVPGGTVNIVSKKPVFANQGYASVQVGRYSSNRAELDVNRVVSAGKLAIRVVGAVQRADDYGDGNFHNSAIALPQLTYRFSPDTQLTVQAQFSNWWSLNFGGIPISLYSGSHDKARLLEGIPRDFVAQRDDITRHNSNQHYRAFFTSNLTENLSMRIAANYMISYGQSGQLNIGAAANQVLQVDPNTGYWLWNGTRNDAPAFTFGGSLNTQDRRYANWQNDFVYELKTNTFKSTTVAGYALNYAVTKNEKNRNYISTATGTTSFPAQVLSNYVYAPYTLAPTLNGWNTRHYRDQQIYLYQVFSFFNERLLLSGGVSRNWYYTDNVDLLRNLRAHAAPDATLPSAGVVFKVMKGLSAYYGYSEQSTAINPSTTATNFFATQESKQHEVGVRTQALDNRLYASLAYFDIKQNNFSVPNPLNSAVPVPSPLLPPLFTDRIAHGVEFELSFAVNTQLSFVGNASVMKNRDADNVPFRGTAERSGALWVNYAFAKGSPLDGLSLGVGVDYLTKRAGDTATGVTSASTPSRVIRVQPSFWLPSRTLVNASAAYRINERWRAQLNIDNLLDEEYLMASTGRTSVWPGTPLNARLTVTYNF